MLDGRSTFLQILRFYKVFWTLYIDYMFLTILGRSPIPGGAGGRRPPAHSEITIYFVILNSSHIKLIFWKILSDTVHTQHFLSFYAKNFFGKNNTSELKISKSSTNIWNLILILVYLESAQNFQFFDVKKYFFWLTFFWTQNDAKVTFTMQIVLRFLHIWNQRKISDILV